MKQIIFFKTTLVSFLFLFIGTSYLPAQTPDPNNASFIGPASSIGPGNNSCNVGLIQASGYFSFPVPTGLTLGQLNHLETDFLDGILSWSDLQFQVIAQTGCGPIELIFVISNTFTNSWKNPGNVAGPGSQVIWGLCGEGQPSLLFSDVQAQYGNAVILSIKLWAFGEITFVDNTRINSTIYNYDDCDGDGLLDMYDCDPAHGGNNKVLVCHEGQTICVAMPALQAHLNHGDYMGSCITARSANNLPPEEVSINEIKLYPNPAINQINIRNNNNKMLGTVSIYDILGKMVYKNIIGSSHAIIDVKNFSPGVYWLRSDQMEKAIKFIKQ